jgi:bifunctional UDP-N-acetylglucosamine pyrophosphorylase / glucosamine-1-phosphate N-acetyltransferase
MSTPLDVIILAAGQGKRMYSALPKVLHTLAGKALLGHVIDVARTLSPRSLHVVYGHGGEQVRAAFADERVQWVHQSEQLGTGHAVMQAMPGINDDGTVLVLYGDIPLLRPDSLRGLIQIAAGDTLAVLTAELPEPASYGRIIRDATGRIARIVERKDATPEEATVTEINTGILAVPASRLRRWLSRLNNRNAQREYYLTDIVAMAVADGVAAEALGAQTAWEFLGINSKQELADVERIHQRNIANELLERGVTLRDPTRLDVRGRLTCGRDVIIDVNVIFEGEVHLADGVKIGPNNVIRNATIGAASEIYANCVIEDATVAAGCRIGPFARLRPGSVLKEGAHVGNFVEIKNSELGVGSKANHLAYIGDATVGNDVNVGAGTITCNYDGANKHRTTIGDRAFIGSNTALVAPVTVGADATIGAGSVISKDAPAGELTVARARQLTIPGWRRPQKKPKA